MSAAESATQGADGAVQCTAALQKRVSPDGGDYTFEEFVNFFGKEDAKWYWEQAKVSTKVK